jgi:hypothetical protein
MLLEGHQVYWLERRLGSYFLTDARSRSATSSKPASLLVSTRGFTKRAQQPAATPADHQGENMEPVVVLLRMWQPQRHVKSALCQQARLRNGFATLQQEVVAPPAAGALTNDDDLKEDFFVMTGEELIEKEDSGKNEAVQD